MGVRDRSAPAGTSHTLRSLKVPSLYGSGPLRARGPRAHRSLDVEARWSPDLRFRDPLRWTLRVYNSRIGELWDLGEGVVGLPQLRGGLGDQGFAQGDGVRRGGARAGASETRARGRVRQEGWAGEGGGRRGTPAFVGQGLAWAGFDPVPRVVLPSRRGGCGPLTEGAKGRPLEWTRVGKSTCRSGPLQ